MNVGQLKERLSYYPEDMEIIRSQDEEGNGFNELYDVAESMIMPTDSWIEQVYVLDEFIGTSGFTEEDRAPKGAIKVLVLWP